MVKLIEDPGQDQNQVESGPDRFQADSERDKAAVSTTSTGAGDRQIALLVGALALALYLRGLAPDLLFGDPGEFQTAAWTWGLAHPTGYPLYLMVGGLWQRLLGVVGVQPALALNTFSALAAAVAVLLLYRLLRGWLNGPPPAAGRIAALFAAALFAVNPTFWSQALIAEVYTLHILLMLLILLAAQQVEHSGLSVRRMVILGLAVGLGLAHHAMTLFLLPGLLLFLYLVQRNETSPAVDGANRRNAMAWPALAGGALLPLLLYLYVPLRAGPDPSPWYHQPLGEGVLQLYDNTWPAFINFMTGRSISVGFYGMADAMGQIRQAFLLWQIHFQWPGLVLVVSGLIALFLGRRWTILALTLPYVLIQQGFNLFYAIGDILVYYVGLYLMAAIWSGAAIHALVTGRWQEVEETQMDTENGATGDERGAGDQELPAEPATDTEQNAATAAPAMHPFGLVIVLLLFVLPIRLGSQYAPRLDQSDSNRARETWEAILAADPAADTILVTNDRNEMVPLFYLQAVEQRGVDMTGLFPLIAPDARFTDLGATVATALDQSNGRPVHLIKAMPGLEVRFALAEGPAPLVQVLGPAVTSDPGQALDAAMGPFLLRGYDWTSRSEGDQFGAQIALQWQVTAPVDQAYTVTVQLFDAAGNKIAQSDQASGGDFYPTSLWKPGERLRDVHLLRWPAELQPAEMLVGLYTGPDLAQPGPPVRIPLSSPAR